MSKSFIPRRVVIHCSASQNGHYYGADHIDADHRARGFDSIGYHMVIEPDGDMELGRQIGTKGAHCIEANGDSVGICLIGTDKFTLKQFKTLRKQLDNMMFLYNISKKEIYPHSYFKSARDEHKTCPNIRGNDLIAWYLTGEDNILSPYIMEEI